MYVGMINVWGGITVTWEGVTQLLARGQLLLVAAGGALETAIGASNLTNVTARGPYMGGIFGTDN